MQIHVEVVIEGQRERQRIATIQRSADLAAVDGLGLTLAESKDLLERLQTPASTAIGACLRSQLMVDAQQQREELGVVQEGMAHSDGL